MTDLETMLRYLTDSYSFNLKDTKKSLRCGPDYMSYEEQTLHFYLPEYLTLPRLEPLLRQFLRDKLDIMVGWITVPPCEEILYKGDLISFKIGENEQGTCVSLTTNIRYSNAE